MQQPELFKLDLRQVDVDHDEIDATVRCLHELDLYRFPYADLDVDVTTWVSASRAPSYRLDRGDLASGDHLLTTARIFIRDGELQPVHRYLEHRALDERDEGLTLLFCDIFLTALNTRGLEQERRPNKKARLGIGKRQDRRYPYITYIYPSAEVIGESGVGSPKRPHIRRGHIRRQRFGPGRKLVKRIWIAPMLIKGGPTRPRDAYMVEALLYDHETVTKEA